MSDREVIVPVPGYEEHYSVSSHGRIFSNNYRGSGEMKELAQGEVVDRRRDSESCYLRVKMHRINPNSPVAVHRLVALAFVPNPQGLPIVNHIDGDKGHNHATNLEWVSVAENTQHAVDTGLIRHAVGEAHGKAVLTEAQVIEIKSRLKTEPEHRGQLGEVARDYGVSRDCIYDIRAGRSWRHVA